MRIGPEDIGKQRPQPFVAFEFRSDLPKKRFCNRPRVRKDPDRDLWVVQYVLDGKAEGDQRTLPVLTAPEIEIAIRRGLHLATALEIPIAIEVSSLQYIDEHEKEIRLRQPPLHPAREIGIIAFGATLSACRILRR